MDDDQLQSNQADGFAEVRALEVIGGHSAFIGTDCDSIQYQVRILDEINLAPLKIVYLSYIELV